VKCRNVNKRMLYALIAVLGSLWLLAGNVFASNTPNDPVYVVDGDRWIGLFGNKNEYAEILLPSQHGSQNRGRLPYFDEARTPRNHGYLRSQEGIRGRCRSPSQPRAMGDCWRSQADRVESATRSDLSGARRDLKVTEVRLFKNSGERNDRFPDWA